MNVYDNSTFFKYDAYLELWTILDTPLDNFNLDEPYQDISVTTAAMENHTISSQVPTPVLHSHTQDKDNNRSDIQSTLLGLFGCGLLLFLIVQVIFFKRKRLFKKNSWRLGLSDKALASPIVKKEDTTIWSPEYVQSVKPGQTSAFMLSPHPFRAPLKYHESLSFCAERPMHRRESSKSSRSSTHTSCLSHEQGKWVKNGQTTVFMVDSRGHFSPRLSVEAPSYMDSSRTPSNGSCISCGSIHYGITYTSKVNGVVSRSHSVLTFEGPTKVCFPVHRQSTISDKSVSIFRCEECYALCERNGSLSPNEDGHYLPSVSLLPDNTQVEMPISMARDSLTSISDISPSNK